MEQDVKILTHLMAHHLRWIEPAAIKDELKKHFKTIQEELKPLGVLYGVSLKTFFIH